MGNVLVWVIWILAALACISSGVAVISFTNPFYSALALIANLASLAVLFLLASAEFVAAAQILVYAGAVMVMFLFVIAYLGGRADAPFASHRIAQASAVVASVALLAVTLVGTFANLVGSWITYAIGYYGGRPFVERWGRYVLLRPHHLETGQHAAGVDALDPDGLCPVDVLRQRDRERKDLRARRDA